MREGEKGGGGGKGHVLTKGQGVGRVGRLLAVLLVLLNCEVLSLHLVHIQTEFNPHVTKKCLRGETQVGGGGGGDPRATPPPPPPPLSMKP